MEVHPPTKTLKPQKEKALMILKMEPLRFCGVTSFWEVEQLRPILAAQKNEKKKEKKKTSTSNYIYHQPQESQSAFTLILSFYKLF